MQLNEAIVLKI